MDEAGQLAAEVQLLGALLEAADPLHRPQQLDLAGRLHLARHLDRAGRLPDPEPLPLRASPIVIDCRSTPPMTHPRGGSQEYSQHEPGLDATPMRFRGSQNA